MNPVAKMTRRYLRHNMKRTVLVIVGIAIATALITGVSTIATSFLGMMETQARRSSNYLVAVKDVDAAQAEHIVETYVPNRIFREAVGPDVPFAGTKRRHFDEIQIRYADKEALTNGNITLRSGRLPEKKDEILLSAACVKVMDPVPSTGNRITLGNGESFTLVGITDTTATELSGPYMGYVPATEDMKRFTLYMDYRKINRSLVKRLDKGLEADGYDKDFNRLLIHANLAGDNKDVHREIIIFGVLYGLIILASVSMIYNAYAISLRHRRRMMGTLSCVGATPAQLAKSVWSEVLLTGVIGTIIGMAAGVGGIALTFRIAGDIIGRYMAEGNIMTVHVNRWTFIVTGLIAALTLFIAAVIPVRKARSVSPLENVRQTRETVVRPGKRRNYRLTARIFGFGGLLARKNMQRSRRRYRLTVISLVFSAIIFLAASSVTDAMERYNADKFGKYLNNAGMIRMNVDTDDADALHAVQSAVRAAGDRIDGELWFRRVQIYEPTGSDTLTVIGLSEEARTYFERETGLSTGTGRYLDVRADKENERVRPFFETERHELSFGSKRRSIRLSLAGGTPRVPALLNGEDVAMAASSFADPVYPVLFMPEEELDKLLVQVRQTFSDAIITSRTQANIHVIFGQEEHVSDIVRTHTTDMHVDVTDMARILREMNAVLLFIRIFIFGFIGLIGLVSAVNMVNAVSNNILQRHNEFRLLYAAGMSRSNMRGLLIQEGLLLTAKTVAISYPIALVLHVFLLTNNGMAFFISPWPPLIVLVALLIFIMVPTLLVMPRFERISQA